MFSLMDVRQISWPTNGGGPLALRLAGGQAFRSENLQSITSIGAVNQFRFMSPSVLNVQLCGDI